MIEACPLQMEGVKMRSIGFLVSIVCVASCTSLNSPERYCEFDQKSWCVLYGSNETNVREIDENSYLWAVREYYWTEPKVFILENKACRRASYESSIYVSDEGKTNFEGKLFFYRQYEFGNDLAKCILRVLIPEKETSLAVFNFFNSNVAVCSSSSPCEPIIISTLVSRWEVQEW